MEGRARAEHLGNAVTGARIEWGPVAAWAGAGATVLVVITTSLVALGYFERFRAPRVRVTFADTEPWCRVGRLADGGSALWVRLGVENVGRTAALGCVGRLIAVTTDGKLREDVDPVQLRWAGVPRSQALIRSICAAANASTSMSCCCRAMPTGGW